MKTNEAIPYFFEKKRTGELSKEQIKGILATEYQFSSDEIKTVLTGITNLELDELNAKKNPTENVLNSIYFSWFFLIFGVIAISVSVFFLYAETTSPLSKYMPWIMIVGGLFILYKHARKIFMRK